MKKFARKDLASTEVFANVKKYMEDNELQYEPLFVLRKSDYQEDDYLYMVAAKHKRWKDAYAVWYTWNESTKSLNGGVYLLEDEGACIKTMREAYWEKRQTYAVEVTETLKRTVLVEASSFEDAMEVVEDATNTGEINLGWSDFEGRELTQTQKFLDKPVPRDADTSAYWYYGAKEDGSCMY